nr:MAG TPA: hypothetical protein [Caudoviricetes sp.]
MVGQSGQGVLYMHPIARSNDMYNRPRREHVS